MHQASISDTPTGSALHNAIGDEKTEIKQDTRMSTVEYWYTVQVIDQVKLS